MKRSLVIGCAAVALAAGCGTASAQSKFDIIMGGDAFFQGAYVDQDRDEGLRSTEFANRFRLNITPTAKADNGLEYGARLRVRASSGTRNTDNDRAFIFVNGSFGTVQAGVINNLADEYGIISPNVDGISGSPDGWFANYYASSDRRGIEAPLPYVVGNLRTLESGDASTKFIYLTPSFAGFQLGASYTPMFGSSNTGINRVKNTTGYRDLGEVQATYKGEFSGFGIEASAAYAFAKADAGFEDLSSVHAGANVSFAGFKFGGSYAFSGDSGYATGHTGVRDNQVWIVGANYTLGPILLAATYTDARGSNVAFGAATAAEDSRAHIYQAGVTYTVAPGLTTGLEYSYVDNKSAGLNNDANIVLWDTRFAF
ncbi:porin [Azospirillum picis]|uniref:Porin n=1 Tax=Azospirillum picis TaxID=488438 RepID=A0ABU0MSG6_9PROT|nr:porin [Azospirillum picis]MBP2301979.1 putative porin [Azospirillum picis]MDQ0536428.1 putative porin [Azospirillum picis]